MTAAEGPPGGRRARGEERSDDLEFAGSKLAGPELAGPNAAALYAAGVNRADRFLADRASAGLHRAHRTREGRRDAGGAERVPPDASLGTDRAPEADRQAPGARLGQSADAKAGEPPEPLDWRPPPTMRERVTRALTVPTLAGAVVFVVAVVITVVMVMMRPHDPAGVSGEGGAAAGSLPGADGGGVDIGAGSGTGAGANEPEGAGGGTSAGTGVGSDGDGASADEVFVHVVGEVTAPGVYELPADARVEAAIEAAGGATQEAVLSGLNLARVVSDGEQIVVPDAKAVAAAAAEAAPGTASGGAPGSSPGAATGTDGAATGTGLVNLNTADAAALETLPRVGPALARRIIDWRQTNGGFASVDQLLEVSGIGAKTLEGFRERVTV